MRVSIAESSNRASAATQDVAPVEVTLEELVTLAAEPSRDKAARCLCPGIPVEAQVEQTGSRRKINRRRSNLVDAQVLCVDFDGVELEAWAAVLEVLTGYQHAWTDSWSHARKSAAQPGKAWRHLFLALAAPASAGEYSATWLALAEVLAELGAEADASKRNIEDAIFLGTSDGSGAWGYSPGELWPVSPPALEPERPAPPPRLVQVSPARATAYCEAIPDPRCEPDFVSALVKAKRACATEAEYRAQAHALALRSTHSDGTWMLSADHETTTQAKIDSVAENPKHPLGVLEERDPIDAWHELRQARQAAAATAKSEDPDVVPLRQRPKGPIDVGEIDLALDELMHRLGEDPLIFRQGDELVRVDGEGRVLPLSRLALREHCVRTIGFVRRGTKGKLVNAGSGGEICDLASVSALIRERVRPLTTVTLDPVPVRVSGGKVEITRPGYYPDPDDPDRGTLHIAGGIVVEDRPATREVAEAAHQHLAGLFADWPFADASCLASAIALILTAICRGVIDGPCPLFVVSSNMRGTGKGLLLRTISILATGVATAETVAAEQRDEQGKQVVAAFRSGRRMIVLDEVRRLAAIHELDSIVTAWPRYSSRTLGRSEVAEYEATPIWCVAGNNVSVEADSVRRTIAIRLETAHSKPEEREDFAIRNVLRHVAQHRASYYQSAIDLIRWSLTLGSEARVRAMGSFEAWSSVVRRGLCQLGADPLDSRESLGIDAVEHDRARLLIEILRDNGPSFASELSPFAGRLEEVGIQLPKLGYALRRERGVIVDGWTITYSTVNGHRRWAAVQAGIEQPPAVAAAPPEPRPEPSPAPAPEQVYERPLVPWGVSAPEALCERGGPGSLAVVDGTGTICRGYFAAPDVPSHGLAALAREIDELRAAKFERIVVCIDSRARTSDHRQELDPGYKANRRERPKPEGLIAQLGEAVGLIMALGVDGAADEGTEADDLIAHFALLGLTSGAPRVTLVTIDKDLEQLVSEVEGASVKVWAKGEIWGPAEIEARRGIPVRYLDTYLALVGDSSDNVVGVEGVGPVTAVKLIKAHGDLEGILAAAPTIKGKLGERLARDADVARRARQLVTLRPDLCRPRTLPAPDPVGRLDAAWLAARGID